MAMYRRVNPRSILMGRLSHGADLLEELTDVCVREDLYLGCIMALGAVKRARIGFYDQETHEYHFSDMDQPLEILNLTGNVSRKDGEIMVHAHVTLADEEDRAYGGHLAPGTIVFAGEFVIEAFDGLGFERVLDEETGLTLWAL